MQYRVNAHRLAIPYCQYLHASFTDSWGFSMKHANNKNIAVVKGSRPTSSLSMSWQHSIVAKARRNSSQSPFDAQSSRVVEIYETKASLTAFGEKPKQFCDYQYVKNHSREVRKRNINRKKKKLTFITSSATVNRKLNSQHAVPHGGNIGAISK